MICPTCETETDGVNHNNRGLKCTACWYPLPSPVVEPALVEPEPERFDVETIPNAIYDRLIEAGYTNPGELWEASDEDLLAIHGIGKVTLAELRAAYGGGE